MSFLDVQAMTQWFFSLDSMKSLHLPKYLVLFQSVSLFLERTRNPGVRDNSNSSNTDISQAYLCID